MTVVRAAAHMAPVDEQAAFADFVRPHWASMARLTRRLCGAQDEDVLQDALALAWRTRRRFDPERGSPQTWLLAITADQVRKHLTRVGRRARVVPLVDEPGTASPEVGLDVGLNVGRSLQKLTPRQRLVIELYYFADLPVAELAVVLSCSEGTVKSTLSDARARLRRILGTDY